MIREAQVKDIDTLVEIENLSFETDRFSRRSFRYLLTKANALSFVEESDEVVRGYATLLFHAGISLARLYSIAVHPQYHGQGIAGPAEGNQL